MGHGAGRVVLDGALETDDGLFMVIAVQPDQSAVEPELRLGGVRRNGSSVFSQIVIVHLAPQRCTYTVNYRGKITRVRRGGKTVRRQRRRMMVCGLC